MSRVWQMVRGGLPAGSLGSPDGRPAEDPRRRRRSRETPPWVRADVRAEIEARLARREPVALIARALGLDPATVEWVRDRPE